MMTESNPFLSFPDAGSAAVYAGPPGRGRLRKKEGMLGGSDGTVEDWHRCVRNLSVSSRENWAHRLIDGTGSYWQSCGQEGKVWRVIKFTKCIYRKGGGVTVKGGLQKRIIYKA